jgi:gas vesicle protein
MSVNSKHIATFILGAAAGLALSKYLSMNDEEKEKMVNDLKSKAHGFKEEAESAFEKAKTYFEELKTKGAENLKEQFGEAEKMMGDLFNKKPSSS